jgi:hypothetical protein
LSEDGTTRKVFESNISSIPTSSLSEKTRRRILSRLKSGGIHCLIANQKKKTKGIVLLKTNHSLTYGRSSGIKGGVDEDDNVVPVEAPFFDDDCVFLPKTRFKNEVIFLLRFRTEETKEL